MNKYFKVLIVLFLFFMMFLSFKPAWGDSGWSTGYDGGGGYSGGGYSGGGYSSWEPSSHSSHDRSSGSYRSDEDYGFFWLIFLIVLFFIIVYICFFKSSVDSSVQAAKEYKNRYYDMNIKELQEILPDETLTSIKEMAFQKFVDIQKAWMEFDYESLKKNCSDELYNTYYEQLEVLKAKGQKNIMDAFEAKETRVINASSSKNYVSVEVYLKVAFYDYVVDKDEKVIQGTKGGRIINNYRMTFIKTNSPEFKKCPKCGSPLKDIVAKRCPYCRSKIAIPSNEFVLSEKTNELTTRDGKW